MYCYVHNCTSTLRIWKVCLHSNMYKINLGTRCSLKMRDYRKWARTWISALLSTRALRKILYLCSWKFHLCLVTILVKGIIDDIIKTAVKTAEVGWFIANIQSDLFWHRCLERQTFGTPRMYTLSPSKSIMGSN
jgi:hypothetical protein